MSNQRKSNTYHVARSNGKQRLATLFPCSLWTLTALSHVVIQLWLRKNCSLSRPRTGARKKNSMWNHVDTGGARGGERTLTTKKPLGCSRVKPSTRRFIRQDRKPTGPFSASAANAKGDHTGSSNLDGKE